MADDSGNTGLGLIVGILAVVVVLIIAFGFGTKFFSGPASTNITIETPKVPVPAPKG